MVPADVLAEAMPSASPRRAPLERGPSPRTACWHPDPLLPNQAVNLTADQPQPFLITVHTSASALPGIYTGNTLIRVGGELPTVCDPSNPPGHDDGNLQAAVGTIAIVSGGGQVSVPAKGVVVLTNQNAFTGRDPVVNRPAPPTGLRLN